MRVAVAMALLLVVGAVLWWSGHEPRAGRDGRAPNRARTDPSSAGTSIDDRSAPTAPTVPTPPTARERRRPAAGGTVGGSSADGRGTTEDAASTGPAASSVPATGESSPRDDLPPLVRDFLEQRRSRTAGELVIRRNPDGSGTVVLDDRFDRVPVATQDEDGRVIVEEY
jgi:hypothetical protein